MPSPKAKMLDNLNRKKYITDKDAEIERVRLRDEKLKDQRKARMEPFWNDFNESIASITKQREGGLINRHGKQAVMMQQTQELAKITPKPTRNLALMNQTNQFNSTKQSQDVYRHHYQYETSKPDTMSTVHDLPASRDRM